MTLDKISSKKVLVRFDYNVPMSEKVILNDFRIRQSLETINLLLQNNNKIIIFSQLGRPKEGTIDNSLSLEPICNYLSKLLKRNLNDLGY